MMIDTCIAPIVDALQRAGINMRGSCCGHGHSVGDIHLQDGRVLLILDEQSANIWMRHSSEMQHCFKQILQDCST